ncbi:MAG: histidine kinase [Bacteroidetes bacterium]|nr:histidine kinase [Bacteroidota bacterium]
MVKASDLIIHITGWLIFLSLPLLFINGQSETNIVPGVLSSPWYWTFLLFYIFVFYTHAYWLVPRLYLKKRWLAYGGLLLALLVAVWLLRPFDRLVQDNFRVQQASFIQMRGGPPPGRSFHLQPGDFRRAGEPGRREPDSSGMAGDSLRAFHPPPDNSGPPPFGEGGPPEQGIGPRRVNHIDVVSIFLFIMILALSMAVQLNHRWQVTEQRAALAEADKANAELSFLKAQINPHFLFNTLNNIYSLAVTQNEHTADSIMKLSNIMRYVSDDGLQDFVPLEHEMDCLSDYIDLQRLRLGRKTIVNLSMPAQLHEHKIAPLLLITFVENAFKYGTSNHEESVISIGLETTVQYIRFSCRNRAFPTRRAAERTGIGISDTRQRLEHLYPGKDILDITNEGGFFSVQLVLQA